MIENTVTLHLFYPLLFVLSIILLFVLCRVYKDFLDNKKDLHFKDKDVEITSEAFDRIAKIKRGTPNEIILNLQNIENNREIHSQNIVINELLERVEKLEKLLRMSNVK